MKRDNPILIRLEIDFISISKPEHSAGRRFQKFSWDRLDPLYEDELQRFLKRFCDAWKKYKQLQPRI
jgi:hypothetical protein